MAALVRCPELEDEVGGKLWVVSQRELKSSGQTHDRIVVIRVESVLDR